jgi:hypothetical protein
VAFEVDRYDADVATGWSVLIKGRAELGEGPLLDRLATAGLRPVAQAAAAAGWVVILPESSPVAGSDAVEH